MTELFTDRLHLRPFRPDDFEAHAAICADPEVMRFIRAGAITRADAWWQLARYMGHWQLRGYGLWAVVERATERLVGHLGFLDPEGGHGFEMGWALARDAWGKGYALEGTRAALDVAFTALEPRPRLLRHPSRQHALDPAGRAARRAPRGRDRGERHAASRLRDHAAGDGDGVPLAGEMPVSDAIIDAGRTPCAGTSRTLFNFEPPATDEEIRASSLQFVRKLSGFNKPSKANEAAFDRAVDEVAAAARLLVASLVTNAEPRDRDGGGAPGEGTQRGALRAGSRRMRAS